MSNCEVQPPSDVVPRIGILGRILGVCVALACDLKPSVADQPGAVVAWGVNNFGQATVPSSATNVVAVAAGWSHSLALRDDGTVVAWGSNGGPGQTNVPAGLSNVVGIAGGGSHSLAVKSDGTVIGWGLGGGPGGQSNVPAFVSNAVAVAAGGNFSVAINKSGGVLGWGGIDVPVILRQYNNAVAISAGDNHCLVLRPDQSVYAFGDNSSGQCNVPPTATNIVAVAAGGNRSLALRADGVVVAWGESVRVPASLSDVVAIAGGAGQMLALTSKGQVVAWWADGSLAPVPFGLSNVVAIAAGVGHSMALTSLAPAILPKVRKSAFVARGEAVTLRATVVCGTSFENQWIRNGSPIQGATAREITVTNFTATQAGKYALNVSNRFGFDAGTFILRLEKSPVVLLDEVDEGGGVVDRVESTMLRIVGNMEGGDVYYTVDGSPPSFTSLRYSGQVALTASSTVRAIAYSPDYTASAEAAPLAVRIWRTYPLSYGTDGGGEVAASPLPYSANGRYVSNAVVTVTAAPAVGWSFMGWSGDTNLAILEGNKATLRMDGPRVIRAIFGRRFNVHTLGNGLATVNPVSELHPFGSAIRVTAVPSDGSYFFGWGGPPGGFANPVVVTTGSNITALFTELSLDQVSLTVIPSGGGSVSVFPAKKVYASGELVTVWATPEVGMKFTGWTGGADGTLNPLSLVLTNSKRVFASFDQRSATNPPVITRSPSSRTLGLGANSTLDFQAIGDGPFNYQWRRNGTPIPGATNSILPLANMTPLIAGRYDVVVSALSGLDISGAAAVAVLDLQWAQDGGEKLPLLILDCASGAKFRFESSEDSSFANWKLLVPVTLERSRLNFIDRSDPHISLRFYRAVPE